VRTKTFLLVSLAAIPLLSAAQSKIQLTFSGSSPHVAFASSGWPTGLPADAAPSEVALTSIDTSGNKPSDYVSVWDRDTNNAAIRTLKQAGETWHVMATDFDHLGNVVVRVLHEGQPVAVAEVDLDAPPFSQRRLLDTSSKGEAAFFGLPPGQLNVSVGYNSGGKSQTIKQSFYEQLERTHADIVLEVSIPDDVQTIGATSPTGTPAATGAPVPQAPNGVTQPGTTQPVATQPGATPAATAAPRNPLGTFVVMLVGFAIFIVGGYYLLKWINANPGELKKLGVQIPEPGSLPDGSMPTAAPAPPKPAGPPPQILLGDAPLQPLTTPMAPVAAVSMASHPKLMGEGGRSIDLASGESLVGRDDGLTVSLAGESTVSRRHASIRVDGSDVVVTDLGSTNGTFVNGARLQGPTPLRVGDTVQFGSVRFRLEG
jgi:hypothetical protein